MSKQWYKYPELLCRQSLWEMAEAGLKATEIAEIVGCSVKSVYKAAAAHEIDLMTGRIAGAKKRRDEDEGADEGVIWG